MCTWFQWKITRTHFLLLQRCVKPFPAQLISLWKGPPKLCIECHLVPLWTFPSKSPGKALTWKTDLSSHYLDHTINCFVCFTLLCMTHPIWFSRPKVPPFSGFSTKSQHSTWHTFLLLGMPYADTKFPPKMSLPVYTSPQNIIREKVFWTSISRQCE